MGRSQPHDGDALPLLLSNGELDANGDGAKPQVEAQPDGAAVLEVSRSVGELLACSHSALAAALDHQPRRRPKLISAGSHCPFDFKLARRNERSQASFLPLDTQRLKLDLAVLAAELVRTLVLARLPERLHPPLEVRELHRERDIR